MSTRRLTAQEFSERFEGVRKRLWLIAAGVLCDRADADDVVQEAAIVALRRLDEFVEGTHFEAWMGRITRHVARNALRGRRRSRAAMQRLADRTDPDHSAGPGAIGSWADDAPLQAALESLEEPVRLCLLLRVVGGVQYQVIAELMEMPEGTAMSHVFRARRKMRGLLEKAEDSPAEGRGK